MAVLTIPRADQPLVGKNGTVSQEWFRFFAALGGTVDLSGYQLLDDDLTDIAELTPTDDDVMQRKAGAWTNRTIAQLITDLALITTGSFTPTLAFGGSSTGIVYTTQTAAWVKIDTLVIFNIALAISNNGSATGDAAIGTLPFSPASNVPVIGRPSNYTIGAGLVPVYDTNGTSIRLRAFNPTTGNVADAQDTQVDTDFSILLAGAFTV